MDEYSVVSFLNSLVNEKNVAAATQNQELCALVFLYKQVLQKPLGELDVLKYAGHNLRIPVVLTPEEVKAILSFMKEVNKLITSLMYGADMRVSEVLRLRIMDLDFSYHQIQAREGKGGTGQLYSPANLNLNLRGAGVRFLLK